MLRRFGFHVRIRIYYLVWDLVFGIWSLLPRHLELTGAAMSMGENNPRGLSDCDSAVRIRVAPEGNP